MKSTEGASEVSVGTGAVPESIAFNFGSGLTRNQIAKGSGLVENGLHQTQGQCERLQPLLDRALDNLTRLQQAVKVCCQPKVNI